MQQNSDSMYSSIFMLEIIVAKSGLNSQEIVIFIPTMGPQFLKLKRKKFMFFLQIQSPSGKIIIYVFSQKKQISMKIWAFFQKSEISE